MRIGWLGYGFYGTLLGCSATDSSLTTTNTFSPNETFTPPSYIKPTPTSFLRSYNNLELSGNLFFFTESEYPHGEYRYSYAVYDIGAGIATYLIENITIPPFPSSIASDEILLSIVFMKKIFILKVIVPGQNLWLLMLVASNRDCFSKSIWLGFNGLLFQIELSFVAIASTRQQQHDIYLYDLNTKYFNQLTNNIERERNIFWSPDDTKLGYLSFRDSPLQDKLNIIERKIPGEIYETFKS